MKPPDNDISLLALWLLVFIMNIMFTIPIIWWAIHSGQFSNLDRSRFLPLDDE